jgi:hypothetical protein
MRILFDHGTPAPLSPFLESHTVTKAKDAGWDKLNNGELLKAAEEAGFEVLVTTDKNMVAQQNLKRRTIAVVVLRNSQWRIVKAPRSKDHRRRERRDTRQLFRGGRTFQIAFPAASKRVSFASLPEGPAIPPPHENSHARQAVIIDLCSCAL